MAEKSNPMNWRIQEILEQKRDRPRNWRLAVIFGSGLLLGGGLAAWAVMRMIAPVPPTESARTAQVSKATSISAKTAPTPTPALHAHVACPGAQAIASASRADGHATLQGEPKAASEVAALILTGKESAAAGRARDAELTFLWACRAADKLQQADAIEPVDARYQLARHYAHVVAVGDDNLPNRSELIRRADVLLTDSLQAYQARYGESHEKTRFAAEGLAALRQSVAQAAPAAPENSAPTQVAAPSQSQTQAPTRSPAVAIAPAIPPAREPVITRATAPPPAAAPRAVVAARPPVQVQTGAGPAFIPPRQAELAAAPPPRRLPRTEVAAVAVPVRQATGMATQAQPSFDCGLARSPAERRICSDAELAQLDRELGRLHARAKQSTADSAAFRRQNEREWRRRESVCRGDRECLLDWYADRREQLRGELDGGR